MKLVFLFDVDNTLLDNDRVKEDLAEQIEALVGPDGAARFWDLYEEVRHERDVVDLPLTLERFSVDFLNAPGYPHLSALILAYPFQRVLFPGAIDTLRHLGTLGTPAILSDGDPVYQPAKIARSGLADAVGNRVLIYPHKEQVLDDVLARVPGDHYVLVDDKPRILATAKAALGDRVTTVLVCQGKYAHEGGTPESPPPDLVVDHVGDLQKFKAADFVPG